MSPQCRTPVAIVGLACRFPGAPDYASFWDVIARGAVTITDIPAERWELPPLFDPKPGTVGKMNTRRGGFIERYDKFDAEFFGINPREARIADPQQRVMLELAWQALEDAGVDPRSLAGTRCGVYIGVSTWDYNKLLNRDLKILDGYVGPGSSLSILANRISYQLDLRGPSMAVDTACSSSLVAMHLALQSLSSGETDRALVGGVNLMLSPETNITFSVAGFMAPDGRCKTFSADADGYVRSEGAAMLVLKRLDDALEAGDPIWGVLRGIAVNQDGASNGLTAPNGAAQQEVIREALRSAAVRPADVSYVELHGTGTPIGDPIEVRALSQVMREGRDASRPCALGAVKANIGHCEPAAGMAGIIKVLLALAHEVIPSQPAFGELNRYVASALKNLPIGVAREPKRWARGERARIATVSSFGFGGVNAHAVLEEPPSAATSVSRPQAADTGPFLLKLTGESPQAIRELARRYRAAIEGPEVSPTACADVCFSVNTSRSDFRLRTAVAASSVQALRDRLAAVSGATEFATARRRAQVGFLFPGEGAWFEGMGRGLYAEPAFRAAVDRCASSIDAQLRVPLAELLCGELPRDVAERTLHAHAAVFAVEYALAELYRAWGVMPAAVYGEGLGEYVACCVAGVVSLDDAWRLVTARALLSESVARLALGQSEELHAPLVDPLVAEFEAAAQAVTYHPPQLTLVHGVDATVAGDHTFRAQYFARQWREPNARTAAVQKLTTSGARILLEVGPGAELSRLGEQAEAAPEATFIAGLGSHASALDATGDQRIQAYRVVSAAYCAGAAVDWSTLSGGALRTRVRVPTYPFQGQRHWLEFTPQPASMAPAVPQRLVSVPVDHLDEGRHYTTSWESQALGTAKSSAGGCWLILESERGRLGRALAEKLHSRGVDARVMLAATPPELAAAESGIVDLRGLSPKSSGANATDRCAQCEDTAANALELLQSSLQSPAPVKARLWFVTSDAVAVAPGERVDCYQTPVWGLGRTAQLELPSRWVGLVDLCSNDLSDLDAVAERLAGEVLCAEEEAQVALRAGARWVARIAPAPALRATSLAVSPAASYLVTGGLGMLGLQVVGRLVERGARNIVVTTRSTPAVVPAQLQAWRAQGVRVEIAVADTRDRAALSDAVGLAKSLAPLRGVVHAAGVRRDTALARMDRRSLGEVLRPKLDGAAHLHELTLDQPLDFFVMFSSVASMFGSPGQANYAAANAFLDGLAHRRHSLQLPATSINWGPWDGGGMVAELAESARNRLRARGLSLLSPDLALLAFERHSAASEPQRAFVELDPAAFVAALPQGRTYRYFERLRATGELGAAARLAVIGRAAPADTVPNGVEETAPAAAGAPATQAAAGGITWRKLLASTPAEERLSVLRGKLVALFAKTIGMPETSLAVDQDLDDQGMDSLLQMEILLDLEAQLELALAPVELSTHTRVDQLAVYLLEQLSAAPSAQAQAPAEINGTDTHAVSSLAAVTPLAAASMRERTDGSAQAHAAPREQRLHARGRTLAFIEWGPEAAPAVILVHGILDQALAWEPVALPLAALGYRVIAPDLRGHGRSSHDANADGYSLLGFCGDLADLVEHLQLENFVLAGHSLGALISAVYTACLGARVAGLLLLETVFIGTEGQDVRAQLQRDLEHMRTAHAHRPMPRVEVAIQLLKQASPNLSPAFASRLCERATRTEPDGVYWAWDPILRTRVGIRFPGRRSQYLELLRQVSIPVRLLFGHQSNFNRALEVEALLEALPDARVDYLQGGHNLHFDNPGPIAAALHELLVHRFHARSRCDEQRTHCNRGYAL